MVHDERRIQRRTAFLAERKIELKLSDSQIEQVIAGIGFHTEIPFQTHEAHERAFKISIRRAGAEPRAPEPRRIHHTERNIAVQRAETQEVQAGETKPSGCHTTAFRPQLRGLIADGRPNGNRPETHADPLVDRGVRVRSQLISAIPEEIAEVVELRESGHVAHVTLKIILAGKGRNRLGFLDQPAQFVTDQPHQDEYGDNHRPGT